MKIHNAEVTGSFILNGVDLSNLTGSASDSGSFSTQIVNLNQVSSSLNSFTSSINTTIKSKLDSDSVISGSIQVSITGTTGYSTFSSSVSSSIGSLSGSVATTTSGLSSSIGSLSSSVATTTSDLSSSVATTTIGLAGRITTIEGNSATTGSNAFIGTQTITGSLYISSDLVVQGSSSLQDITASAVNIGANIVNLNTANPAIRFAGLNIFDSGSIGGSGSFLYDSVQDEFIFVHRGDNTNITSSVVLMGAQTYNNIGSEIYPTSNYIQKGTGNEHLGDSCIIDNGTTVCVNATLKASGQVCGVMGTFTCIGIATITPSTKLDVYAGSDATSNLVLWGQTIRNEGNGAATGYGAGLKLKISSNDATNEVYKWAGIAAVAGTNYSNRTDLALYSNAASTVDAIEKVRITGDGNVGINTCTPSNLLHIEASNNTTNQLRVNSCDGLNAGLRSYTTSDGPGLLINHYYAASGSPYLRTSDFVSNQGDGASTQMRFFTKDFNANPALAMIITSGRSVGIGTDTPSLHSSSSGLVVKGIGARGIIEVWDGTSGKGVFQQVGGTTYIGNLDKGASGGSLRFLINGSGTSATEAMIINCLGRVLINNSAAVGTGADYSRVTISGTCNKTQASGVGGAVLHLSTCENDTPFGLKIAINGAACNCLRYVAFQTGDHNITNQGNITFQESGGSVLMGTTTSSGIGILNTYKAPVNSNYVDQIVVQGTGNYPSLRLGTYDAYDAVIATTGNDLRILAGLGVYTENHDIMFYTSFNGGTGGAQCYERMRIRYDGNVGIGSNSPSAKLQVAGTIYNSATAGGSNYTLDTMGAYQSIANGGFVDFNAMSGFLMVNNWSNGATTLFVMGGGNTGVVGTITGTAGAMFHNPAVGGYRWCQTGWGSTANFGFQVFRTRNTA